MTLSERRAAAVEEIVRRALEGEEQATVFLEGLAALMRTGGVHDLTITVHQGRWARAERPKVTKHRMA